MADLTEQEKSLIWALLERSEALRHTRERFRTIVSGELDKVYIAPARRELIFEFARQRAENSAALASDTVQLAAIEDARRTLKDSAARLASAPWRTGVRDRWPAPIAHEIERLFDEMHGRRFASDERLDPSADSALLQFKDAFEVLIKFTATVLMRGLIETDRDRSDWARRQLFRRGLSLGHWTGMLREAVSRYNDDVPVFGPLVTLARASRRKLLGAAGEFVTVRNNVIGHGSRSLNSMETAELVVGCLETGKVQNLRGDLIRLTPLAAVLETMVSDGAYEGIALEAGVAADHFSLSGAGAADRWLADERHTRHDGTAMSTSVRLSDGLTLSLAPFVAARICSQCGRRDVFLYDSLHDTARGGRFDLLDYARGHKSRLHGAEASDLSDALGDLVPEDAPELVGASTNFGHVLEALDKARVDRNYLSPAYLRDDLADFLRTHDRGVFWLQAPAHVGKTTFVQGLAEAEIGDRPIDPRFESAQGGKCVAYYCRKEYRTGLAGMVNTLQDKLQAAYDPSQNLRNEQPQARSVVEAGTPRAFLNWLLQWEVFAERYRLATPGAPLLVAIDGLDEADPPPESTPLQVLPHPNELPKGIYLLLTSRPVGDVDAPGFLATHIEACMAGLEKSALRVRRCDLGSAPYQALLRDYLCRRLSLDLANMEDVALSDAIVRSADSRFAYVTFLADRREVGQASAKNIAALATGSGLYRLWLANLEREYGRKQAEAIRQVVALLAAVEEAHAWVFGEGRKVDPATGAALTPLPEQFAGLEISLLARLLDLNRPQAEAHDHIDPGLLFTVQKLQGVLWVSRAGAGTTWFRLALKEFLPAAKDDPVVGPMLKLMQARVAARALDAADQIIADDDETGQAWALLEPLAPLIEALVHLSGSDPIAQRWNPTDIVSLLCQRDDDLRDQGRALGRVPGLTLIAALGLPPRHPPQALPIELAASLTNHGNAKAAGSDLAGAIADYELAASLQNRGNAKAAGSDLAGAMADYDAAIALMQASRTELGEAWPVPLQDNLAMCLLQDDLAMCLQNRGNAKARGSDLAGAIADYDAAIVLREAIRAALDEARFQNNLAAVLQNRGLAKADGGDLAGAIADYEAAIVLMQAIRTAPGEAWSASLRDQLAGCLQNLGLAKAAGGDLAGAIADYDTAITLMQEIPTLGEEWPTLGEAWPVPMQNNLATGLQNRGLAKSDSADLGGAIADYDAAIALMQAIRAALGEAWPVPLQDNLAMCLLNRGVAKARGGDLASAIADYDAAIVLREAIRAALGEAWPVPFQNNLAGSLQNRGNAKAGGGDLGGAIADYDAAIALMQAIRAALGEAWPVPLQSDLANSFQNRGNAKSDGGDLAGAIADYDAAIALMQAIRAALGEAWPVPFQNNLANSFQNSGNAKSDGGDLAGAIADYDAAIVLRQAIRAALGEAWPVPFQSNLANSFQNRGNAKSDGGDLAGAIADYDAAIVLRQAIRAALGEAWPVPMQSNLANSFQNRGNAKSDGGDLAGAIADYDAAIALMQAIRAALGEAWPVPFQNNLANSFQNSGNAKSDGGDLAGAIADYDAAIVLRQAIRAALGEAWPVPMQNDLANSFQSRGIAKVDDGDLASAIADYDAAIVLRQAIRAVLGEAWPVPMQSDLANSFQNRGVAKADSADLAGAIADYDAAIALMQAIRAALGEAWPVPLQSDLARSLQNLGLAKAAGGDLAGAIADYDAAIALMQAIRAALGEAWPVPLQSDLANSFQNRGNAKSDGGDLAGAIADYDAAIALMQAIRAALGEAWPVPFQSDLARSLQNRGNAKSDGGDLAGAIADYDAAIALMQAIRAALGEAWPVPMQNNLTNSFQNRGVAKADSADLAGAIADYDAAIALMQAIRAALGEAWPVPLQNDLAMCLQSRGIAKVDDGDLASAIADYDAAISLMEDVSRGVGQAAWSSNPSWTNTLHTVRANRAMALERLARREA